MFTTIVNKVTKLFSATLDFFIPFGHLTIRFWLAYVFFAAGILKLESWVSTVYLFTYEYQVPLLPPEIAAGISTFVEIVWPALLILGLGGRFMYVVLFVYNIVCIISYPVFFTPDGYAGLQQHINWGLLIMMLMFYGSGKFSVDYLIQHHWFSRNKLMKNKHTTMISMDNG